MTEIGIASIWPDMVKSKEQKEGLLHIYHASASSEPMLNMVKIAGCLGISVELVDLSLSNSPAEDIRAQLSSGEGASVWDVGSLGVLMGSTDWASVAALFAEAAANVLILVTGENHLQNDILTILSQGGVAKVRSAGRPESVRFPVNPTHLGAELSGHRYARSGRDAIAMDVSEAAGIETVMELGEGQATFVFLRSGGAHAFIWSTLSVFDVDRPLEREIEFEQAADEYIPAIIFLRTAFGEHCWHSPTVGADIIIDDPLLEKRYGFIGFQDLLRLTKELGFHITVAFIPWNHWRTRLDAIRGFLAYPDSFGICAHGCDHTKNEFRTSNYPDLLGRSHLAAERMDRHRDRTGMGWDRLMVYPREEYTIHAIQALADSGHYLGMVNTGCIPRDMESKCVRGSDLLLPAQDAFFGFPLFKRHYWSDISVFAMAAFLGKPAILVEHHDFFQDQCRAVKDFVTQLGAMCPAVRWSGLTDLATRTHSRRRAAPDTFEVRFFTDEFVMENPDSEPRIARFRRRIPASTVIESISVNDAQVSYVRDGEFICFEARMDGNGTASVHIQRRAVPDRGALSRGWAYGARVAIRRLLSEIRDNGQRAAKPWGWRTG